RIEEALEELVTNRAFRADRVGRKAERATAQPGGHVVDPGDERALHHVRRYLEAGRRRPVDRKQAHNRPDDQEDIDDGLPGEAPCAERQIGLAVAKDRFAHVRGLVKRCASFISIVIAMTMTTR